MSSKGAPGGSAPTRLGFAGAMSSCTWGPGPRTVAVMSHGGSMVLDRSGVRQEFSLHGGFAAFSRDGSRLITWNRRNVWMWGVRPTAITLLDHIDFTDDILTVEWAPNGRHFGVGLADGTVVDMSTASLAPLASIFTESRFPATCAWLDQATLVRLWSPQLDLLHVYESPFGQSLVAVSSGTVEGADYLAALDVFGVLHVFEPAERRLVRSFSSRTAGVPTQVFLGFSPSAEQLAVGSPQDGLVHLWSTEQLVRPAAGPRTAQYRNAKVVLVGDSGVGKSGLALPLAHQAFEPTESTHGRHVWTAERSTVDLGPAGMETREVLLWDLAGQPGYRLFHRLSLKGVSVGLVVFDARSESDPFRGVSYWAKALNESAGSTRVTKILVSARSDRGTVRASRERIEEIVERGGFDGFFETSARTGDGVAALREAMDAAIDWASLPVVVAPDVFVAIREFLVGFKERSNVLIAHEDELLAHFERSDGRPVSRPIFGVSLQRLEAAGLIARVSVGERWLLQPEVLDDYAAWLSQAARREPDGLGAIAELDALAGSYPHEALPRAQDETLMLLTAVEEVVGRGLALRVPTDEGQILVFPSELRVDLPDYPGGYDLRCRSRSPARSRPSTPRSRCGW